MFVHSADKLAEMRTKFHVIQAKLIMSVWCFTVQCYLCVQMSDSVSLDAFRHASHHLHRLASEVYLLSLNNKQGKFC